MLLIGFDLGEVGVEGDVEVERRAQRYLGVEAEGDRRLGVVGCLVVPFAARKRVGFELEPAPRRRLSETVQSAVGGGAPWGVEAPLRAVEGPVALLARSCHPAPRS